MRLLPERHDHGGRGNAQEQAEGDRRGQRSRDDQQPPVRPLPTSTPGESVARKRAWGAFSTGGSRGIRESEKYVREGGAAARMMLIQAAANEWKVPASECTASNSTVKHASGKTLTYGKLAEAAAKLDLPKGS